MRNWSLATTLRPPPVATSAPPSTSPDIPIVLRINSAPSISSVSGSDVPRVEVGAEHRDPASGGVTVLLCSTAEAGLDGRRDALSEEGSASARDTQPGGGRACD